MADINNTKYYNLIKAPGTRPLFPPEMEEPQPVINPNLPGLLVDHNSTLNKDGGDGVKWYHLGQDEYNKVQGIVNPTIGMTWLQGGNISGASAFLDITFGNNLFLAVDFDNGSFPLATSTDGITWIKPTVPSIFLGWIMYCAAYGNGLFVVLGNKDNFLTSPDGVNWTSRSFGFTGNNWQSVVFANGIFVAVGQDTNRIMSSSNGIDWFLRTSPIEDNFRDVVFGNGLFVATGTGSTNTQHIITSPDGVNWTTRNSVLSNSGYESLVFGNNLFVAIRSGSNVSLTSVNGIDWVSVTLPVSKTWTGIGFGANLYVLVSNSAGTEGTVDNILTSTDGTNWTPRTILARTYRDVIYAKNRFVILHNFGSAYSVGKIDLYHSSLNLDDGKNPHGTRYEDLIGTPPSSDRNVDGGTWDSVYLPNQNLNGGTL